MRRSAIFQAILGHKIISGPFKGYQYCGNEEQTATSVGAKILGTYELDLHRAVESSMSRSHDLIVNIGAGDGYYAVGLAGRNPGVQVVAFEANDQTRDMLQRNVASNHLGDQIGVQGWCGIDELNSILGNASSPYVVIDVEGAEKNLLAPEQVPALRKADILVEVHDFVDPELGPLLRSRFSSSHHIEEIKESPRTASDLPYWWLRLVGKLFEHKGVQWMAEGRPGLMRWFYMTPL